MIEKLDLTKIKEEIASRKNSGNMNQSQFGETVGTGVSPRDTFLHGLVEAYKYEKPTPSSNLIKTVDNTVASKKGETAQHATHQSTPTAPVHALVAGHQPVVQMSAEREEQMYKDFETKNNNQTLAESISTFQGTAKTNPAPQGTHINYAGTNYLTTPPIGTPMNEGQVQMPMQLNEAALVESVKQIVNTHLTENLGPIFEEAIKNTIIEMYAVERIQEVLLENKDLIREAVMDVIREIKAKSKK